MTFDSSAQNRTVVFVSKATPGDDEFVLWLAPKLEAAGYHVFADILTLEAGGRWRKAITDALQQRAVKMLLCCSDETLACEGVQEEIGIASDLVKELGDPTFIIPLRLNPYRKIFGIGELQYVDFVRGWSAGLAKLLDALKRQKVVQANPQSTIKPDWELLRRRGAIPLKREPERLTSNWLRMAQAPDLIRHFEPTGAVDRDAVARACKALPYPAEPVGNGFLSFGVLDEINAEFVGVGRFRVGDEVPLLDFIETGSKSLNVKSQDASNLLQSMLRQAWNRMCRDCGLLEYEYSNSVGFHASKDQVKVGQKVPWGRQGDRRSSMLRNVARGHVWQYGVSATPAFWPFPHFKLKSRVLFASPLGDDADRPIEDTKKQHRLRRSVCKGWRNKQWHGRLLAFLELLCGDSAYIDLALGASNIVRIEAAPILFTSPVSTVLPDQLGEDDEEDDDSTLGRPEPEDEP
ncbi:MAG TPA: toll/interleukin-1 receptor domain-containing protein [Caulobacteraceae bacterium]|nr:toll/interleukin-1 receptor domain-containing protein [Caulobacteraceae bacterium]